MADPPRTPPRHPPFGPTHGSDIPSAKLPGAPRPRPLGLGLAAFAAVALLAVGYKLVGPAGRQTPPSPAPSSAAVAACGASVPPPAGPKTYSRTPKSRLARGVDYGAVIRTSCGDIKIDLLENKAPGAVANFVFLANEGFYDGLIWHYVTYDLLIQTGDPNGQNGLAPDGPGYTIKDEFPKSNRAYVYGAVGFANTGKRNSAGSQFFIVIHDLKGALESRPEPLDIKVQYTIFGRVQKRFFGSVEAIARQPVAGGADPVEAVKPAVPVYVESIEILERKR